MFCAQAKSLKELPSYTQTECILPIFSQAWTAMKPIILARQDDSEIISDCADYLGTTIKGLGIGTWMNA